MTNYAQAILELRETPLNNPKGPTWYRGTARCSHLVEGDRLTAALAAIGADKIVIGHTPTSTRRVQQRQGGRVIEIDTGMLSVNYGGEGNALIIEDGAISIANQTNPAPLTPIPHPGGVGVVQREIDDETLEKVLLNGILTEVEADDRGGKLYQVVAFDSSVFATFNATPGKNSHAPEVAAYKLDRLLGLHMVPVTVQRKVNGIAGILQYAPPDTMNEQVREATGQGHDAVCSMESQHAAMRVFDTLIQNRHRTPETMLYEKNRWQLILTGHENAFGSGVGRPEYVQDVQLRIGNEWKMTLQEISDEKLKEVLGDVLDTDQLIATGKRKDNLIKGTMN